jgi:predicted nucleotidyltransferase component of viral defense system
VAGSLERRARQRFGRGNSVITRPELVRRAAVDRVTGQTVERDYVLAAMLVGLGQDSKAATMVFKGGTALRACYYFDYRYSADLDFSLIDGMTVEEGLHVVGQTLARIGAGVGLTEAVLDTNGSVPLIRYVGPWGRENRIKVDLQDDELVVNSARLPILQRYDGIPEGATVVGYTEDEIGAEKLRCVLQRKQCRDPYDLHYLLINRRIEAAEVHLLFERKATHKGLDPASLPGKLDELLGWCKARWETELKEYVRDVPPFGAFERELRRALRPVLR